MRDIKQLLKEAREAIKNKNYDISSKLCKQILKEDPNNYMALVFLGVSFQETGNSTKACTAFKDATKLNPTNSLAWNGLINYYEKLDTKETKPDLVKGYISLLNTDTTEKKLIESTQKIQNLCEYGNIEEITSAIYSLLKSEKVSNVTEIATSLVEILSKEKNLPSNLLSIYEECLSIVVNDQKTICIKYYTDYLNVLYKLEKKTEVFNQAKRMHLIFQSDWISLKWICKIYNEIYVETSLLIEKIEDMKNYSDTLFKLEPQSATAMFTKSILLVIERNEYIEAKDLLEQVVISLPGLLHAWILLLKYYVQLNLFSDAIQAANKIDKILQSSSDSKQNLKNTLNVIIVEVLSRSDEADNLKRALQLAEMLKDDVKSSCISHIIRAHINLKNFQEANQLLEDLKRNSEDEIMYELLTAQLLHKQEKYSEALAILESKNVDLGEWWLQIGTIYWESGRTEKCLVPFLKATKLDPSNFKCFLLLGDYYKKIKDLDKARRCYEKAFKLNTKSSEAGVELSKIYRKRKNWDANLALLQALTGGVINRKNSWAWMQLGLHYLEQRDYDRAITNLRFVIRVDADNMNAWESLADAYLAKGAYTSALKCYEKVSLSENAQYPLMQMATIKQMLGEHAQARSDFEQVLDSNNLYVPALKGVAETYLLQARECFRDQRLGTCRDYAECAAVHLITALQQRSDLGCLWKLLGDTCLMITKLPKKYCHVSLPKSFMEETESKENTTLDKTSLFNLTAKCYYKGICSVKDNVLLWHDLAVCYLSHSHHTEDTELSKDLNNKALIIAQHCTSNNPTDWQHWNLLGNVAMHANPPNYSLAQHSFIKAVTADNNSAISWCNLGTLYFMLDDYKLANEAYSQAQRADPNYIGSWIGQGLLAESFNHEDAMDLFRHSTQLGFHEQSAVGYAHWVCNTLKKSPLDAVIYSIHNMHAIPVACDLMTWYTEHNPSDGTAWTMLGILMERMGLMSGSLEAFKNALDLCEESHQDLAKINYGRLLTRKNRFSQALQIFADVKSATFNSGSALALALFKAQRYKESYETYESTLHWLSDDSLHQSELLVALASMAYMFEGQEAAKTLLFQSVHLEKSSPWGFYATLALGLLHQDLDLAALVLNELKKFTNQIECLHHIAILLSYYYLSKNKGKIGVRELSRIIHTYPDQAGVWLTLSLLLIRLHEERPSSKTAAKCAHIAIKLGQNNMDITKVLYLVALSFFVVGDKQTALVMAQKAIHSYPDSAEGWTILTTILLKTKKLTVPNIKNILSFAKTLTKREDLNNWIQTTICSL